MSRLVQIPFSGFYCSYHESELDNAVEMMSDQYDNADKFNELVQCNCDWSEVFIEYAQQYVVEFANKFELESLKFESLDSPKYYNFSTDRIFAHISFEELSEMYNKVDKKALRKYLLDNFTSYDGFLSHYSNNLEDWGDFAEWDHNQFGALLNVYIVQEEGEWDQYREVDLMDRPRGNGKFDDWICKNTPEIGRYFRIFDYLKSRSER